MVQSAIIKCRECGTLINIKYQLDNTINLFKWRMVLECPKCSDVKELEYSTEGLNYKLFNEKEGDDAYLVGYSACLPVPDVMYYKLMTYIERKMFFSTFLTLSSMYGEKGSEFIAQHSSFISQLTTNVFPYRACLKSLLPLLRRKDLDPKVFSNKYAHVFDVSTKKMNPFTSYIDCKNAYDGLIKTTYQNLCSETYKNSVYAKSFMKLWAVINVENKENLQKISEQIKAAGIKYNEWEKKSAYSYIAEIVNRIEVLYPTMFYGTTGEYLPPRNNSMHILTATVEYINETFGRGYEVLVQILPFVIGLQNYLDNSDCNTFVVDGNKMPYALKDCMSLQAGALVQKLSQNRNLSDYFNGVLNTSIRNAIKHEDVEYDATSQTVKYYANDNYEQYEECLLIDVAFMVYMQLLHIMEIVMLINQLNKRIK